MSDFSMIFPTTSIEHRQYDSLSESIPQFDLRCPSNHLLARSKRRSKGQEARSRCRGAYSKQREAYLTPPPQCPVAVRETSFRNTEPPVRHAKEIREPDSHDFWIEKTKDWYALVPCDPHPMHGRANFLWRSAAAAHEWTFGNTKAQVRTSLNPASNDQRPRCEANLHWN